MTDVKSPIVWACHGNQSQTVALLLTLGSAFEDESVLPQKLLTVYRLGKQLAIDKMFQDKNLSGELFIKMMRNKPLTELERFISNSEVCVNNMLIFLRDNYLSLSYM
ncbi:MAG: hypothetical protein ABI597_03555 [Gammaproteobacteria bacterium]